MVLFCANPNLLFWQAVGTRQDLSLGLPDTAPPLRMMWAPNIEDKQWVAMPLTCRVAEQPRKMVIGFSLLGFPKN